MSVDIIEIAIDNLTDHVKFEKLASEVMRDEGFPNIKPLGGVGDKGKDAKQESFFLSEARNTLTVFQYTLQERLGCKIDETICKLAKNKIEYQLLVVVTTDKISSERQDVMIRDARKKYGVNLSIFDRKTLINRLANYENGIFHRHFPDIEKQIKVLTSRKPELSNEDASLLEISMLKAAIAFTFNPSAPGVKKSLFDYMIFALLLKNSDKGIQFSELGEEYHKIIGAEQPPHSMIHAAIQRLKSKSLVEEKEGFIRPTHKGIETVESSTIQANISTDSLISDIIDQVCRITGEKLSVEVEQKIARNIRNVLVTLFQLFGIELSNLVLLDSTPSPIYFESSEKIIQLAKRQLPSKLGEFLIAILAQTIKNPTEDQAQTLTRWALAYLGSKIMNLDPSMKEFQATRLREKIFILDTDFILDCIVQECPISDIYLNLMKTLKNLGCRLIIPESCIDECITHASIAPQTYRYFEQRLLSLTELFVDEKVGNVFVKGYYYGCVHGKIQRGTTFLEFLSNYYERTDPERFFRNIIQSTFQVSIEVLEPISLLSQELPKEKLEALTGELLESLLKSKKGEYRSQEENQKLAELDAQLFLTAIYLSGEPEKISGRILGGLCYLITSSGRYLKSAKKIGIRDPVTTRPQSIIALLELIGGTQITPTEFASLFENPLLIYAVSQAWDDVKILLESGIELQGKSLARLKWDLEEELHNRIAAISLAEAQAEAAGEDAALSSGDSEYIDLLKSASSRGYKRIPGVDSLMRTLEKAHSDVKLKAQEYEELIRRHEELEKAITYFGKKKQRYLKRIAHKKLDQ